MIRHLILLYLGMCIWWWFFSFFFGYARKFAIYFLGVLSGIAQVVEGIFILLTPWRINEYDQVENGAWVSTRLTMYQIALLFSEKKT